MRTTFDAISIIYKVLKQDVSTQISGDIYKLVRPLNSKKEDIVINALPASEGLLQELALNINCYVPDIEVNVNGQVDKLPDTKRMNEVALLVIDAVEDVSNDDNHFFITNQAVIQDQAGHYVNIRLMFLFTNV